MATQVAAPRSAAPSCSNKLLALPARSWPAAYSRATQCPSQTPTRCVRCKVARHCTMLLHALLVVLTPLFAACAAGRVCGGLPGHHLGARRCCAAELQLQAGKGGCGCAWPQHRGRQAKAHSRVHGVLPTDTANSDSCAFQDEFKFYLEDASSKLLVVPAGGNTNAEAAAAQLGVPVATFAIPSGTLCMLPVTRASVCI